MPATRDLGDGFKVRRALTGLDVRPHPHIGLATVTYLFAGIARARLERVGIAILGGASGAGGGALTEFSASRSVVVAAGYRLRD